MQHQSSTTSRRQDSRPRDSHIFTRADHDWYLEETWCSKRLFEVEPFDRSVPLLDPCTGTGRIANAAKAAGYRINTADIISRGYPGCRIQNFLTRRAAVTTIVCNPPFDSAEAFARHAFKLGAAKVAMIYPVACLNAAQPWLSELPLGHVLLMSPRPSMPPGQYVLDGGKVGGGKRDFCWLIFERGYTGEPRIRWLHRDDD